MRRPARSLSFLAALAAQRRTPGNCSRCGRPNPEPAHKGAEHGRCPACRQYQRAWKARNKPVATPGPIIKTVICDPAQFYHFQERVRRLEELVRDLKRFGAMRYRVGYVKGQYRERCRWRDMARPWDSHAQPLDMQDKKQHFAAMREAVG